MPVLPGPLSTPFGALAAAAAVVTTLVGAVALRNRSTPGAGWLAVVMLVDALVAAFAVGGYAVPQRYQVQVALAVGGIGLLGAVPFVAFVVAYTGRGRHLTYWSLLGYGGPLFVAAALYATTQYHGLMLQTPVGVRRVAGLTLLEFGGLTPLLGATLLYVGLVLFGSLLLVLQTVVRHDRLYLGQSAVLFVVAVAPMAAALPSVGGFRAAGATGARSVAVAAALMTLSALALAYAAARYRLFDFVPAVRQLGDQAAIDDLDEGILLVDAGDNVVKLNAAAEAVLDADGADVVGTPATELFAPVGVEGLSSTPATFERASRTYEVTASPITDERDRPIGRTFVLRDVTRQERRKQRLQVLNRVLRHNVRNDMSVVRMNADIVAEEGDERLAPLGEKMVDIADDLVEIGENVRRTEQLLSAEELSVHDVELEGLLSAVVEDAVVASERRSVDAAVDVDDDVETVPVNRELLELAMENVVENAIEHNEAAVPRVAVTAERVEGGVRVTVADDGPGIPEQELSALDSGRETDLQHASSLGLWLVLWGVSRLGGDLDIVHLEPTGTAVAVWLPDDSEQAVPGPVGAPEADDAADMPGAGTTDRSPGRVDGTAVARVADGVAGEEAAAGDPTAADDGAAAAGSSGDPGDAGAAAAGSSGDPGDAGAAADGAAGRSGGGASGDESGPTMPGAGEPSTATSDAAPSTATDGATGTSGPPRGTPNDAGGGDPGPPRPPASAPSGRTDGDEPEATDDGGDEPEATDDEDGVVDADPDADGGDEPEATDDEDGVVDADPDADDGDEDDADAGDGEGGTDGSTRRTRGG